MKKILICTLLTILGLLHLNAQIQRTFLECPFGTSKQVVIQKMKAKGFVIENRYDGYIVKSTQKNKVQFGGFTWDEIHFGFYKNVLKNVTFVNYGDLYEIERIKGFYILLKDKLQMKYSDYLDPDPSEGIICWSDGKTFVADRYTYIDNKGNTIEKNSPYAKRIVWALIYEDLLSMESIDGDSEL